MCRSGHRATCWQGWCHKAAPLRMSGGAPLCGAAAGAWCRQPAGAGGGARRAGQGPAGGSGAAAGVPGGAAVPPGTMVAFLASRIAIEARCGAETRRCARCAGWRRTARIVQATAVRCAGLQQASLRAVGRRWCHGLACLLTCEGEAVSGTTAAAHWLAPGWRTAGGGPCQWKGLLWAGGRQAGVFGIRGRLS